MPGLVGIIKLENEKKDHVKLLSGMCQSVKHETWYKIDTHITKTAGLARVHLGIFNPEPQPIFNEDRTLCILMEGEIYDYQDLKKELILKGHQFSIDNDPEFIIHLFEEYGEQCVHKLNGSFTLVIWNEKSQKLMILNDRYGLRPLYYALHDECLLFGSEVKSILQDETFERIVDDKTVAEFFSYGYIVGNKTLFREIKLIPPASMITYEKGQISIEKYWDFKFKEEYEDYPEDYYVKESSRLIMQAVKRQMKGNHRIGVPLSGGFDSRTIVASIDKEHYPIHTFTFGRRNSYDVDFAQMIADQLGTVHHFFEFEPDDLASYAQMAVFLTDGMKNCIHAHRMQTYNEMRQYIDVTLSGWIGDSTIGRNRDIFNVIEDDYELFKGVVFYHTPADLLSNLFKDEYYQLIDKNLEMSKNHILQIGRESNIKYPGNRFMYINLKERQRRFSLMGHILVRSSLEVRTPFSDYDFIDFNLKIPPKLKIRNRLYKKVILTMFPHLANIPNQKTGRLISLSVFQDRIYNILQLFKTNMNMLCKRIFKTELFADPRDFARYDDWMRNNKRLREYIFSILMDERVSKRPYFNQEYIKEILDDHMSGKRNYSELIGRLMTFELWNRLFIDK